MSEDRAVEEAFVRQAAEESKASASTFKQELTALANDLLNTDFCKM